MEFQMGHYLQAVCKTLREEAGVSPGRVATAHDPEIKQPQTITEWENGEIHWPRDPDERVRVYADLAGVEPIELWQRAIDLWKAAPQDAAAAGPVGPRLDTARDAQSKPGSQRAKSSRRP